jgi:TM2 domain-containing membrane protein YozV
MNNPVIIGLIAWFFPGAGHLVQKRTKRGLIIAATIWTMFIIAILSGGAYYPGFEFKDGTLLYLLNVFAKTGNGLGVLISFLASVEPKPNIAALATFEYGGRFLETAGLLNYLAIMDALDIYFGRKK